MQKYDVVVAGGGPAGIGAAFSASLLGLKAAIIERHAMLGGNWTNAYVLSILGVYTYSGKTKIVGGIADKIISKLKASHGTLGKSGNFVPFRPAEMSQTLGTMCKDLGVDCYFSSMVSGVKKSGRRIESLEVSGKNGVSIIAGRVFVDSTGDADVAHLLNLHPMSGKEGFGYHQEATLPFRIGGVNEGEYIKYAKSHPKLADVNVRKDGSIDRLHFLKPFINAAKSKRKLYLPHSSTAFFFNTSRRGELVCNATHAPVNDFSNGKEIAALLEDLRRQAISIFNFSKRNVPGFEDSYLMDIASYVGLRETRRAVGEYVLTKDDILNNRRFTDAIARCGHPIEMHDPNLGAYYVHLNGGDDSWYHIPYRSIVVKGIDNLLAVGRCFSADFEAQASARVSGTAIAMGQAAATAAYLSLRQGVALREVNVKKLQFILKKNGAII
ncbi:MAG: FAD-dependent oxidoreductase [Candidatus Micrarchaeaceae archaeon]